MAAETVFQGEIQLSSGLKMKPTASQQVDFADLGSGATDTITFSGLPTGDILIGVAVEVDTAWTSGSGNTTGLTVELGTTGTDPNRAAESLDLIGLSTGFNVWPAGVALGEVLGAGTWDLLFTATGGGSQDLDDIDAGDAVFHLYTITPVATTG